MVARRGLYIGLAGVLCVLLLWTQAAAKGVVQITVSGPGLPGEIEIVDADAIALFGEVEYTGHTQSVPEPLPAAYFEIHQTLGYEAEIIATNVYHYYPGGEAGYFYYADVIGGFSTAEGTWFVLAESSDQALRAYLAKLGASPQALGIETPVANAPPQPARFLQLVHRFARMILAAQ